LHVDLALDAINYETTDAKKTYSKSSNTANSVVDCPYFTTNFIPLDGALSIQKTGDSFTVYMVVDGEFSIKTLAETYKFELGDTVLIPAALKKYELVGNASILEIYIK